MELQHRFSVSMNVYEEGSGDAEVRDRDQNDGMKTEDIYQSLHRPTITPRTTPISAEPSKWNYMFLLFAVNILLSICILAIVGSISSHNKETQQIKGQKEVWLLHNNVFYLFWSDGSDCRAAQSFCQSRNASLAVLSMDNKGWLMFKTNGKQFLFSRASSDGSGDFDSPFEDDDGYECDTLTSDSHMDHGFVCERKVNASFS